MFKTKSKYTFSGGFGGLLFGNIFSIAFLFIHFYTAGDTYIKHNRSYLPLAFMLFIIISTFWGLIRDGKYIVMSPFSIKFITLLLPFIRKDVRWEEYSFYILVDEKGYRKGKKHEAVWLIKHNGKRHRFSSYYYRNYSDLKEAVPLQYMGKKSFSDIQHWGYNFGMKINIEQLLNNAA